MGEVLSITDHTTLTIRAWIDPVVDATGFEPRPGTDEHPTATRCSLLGG